MLEENIIYRMRSHVTTGEKVCICGLLLCEVLTITKGAFALLIDSHERELNKRGFIVVKSNRNAYGNVYGMR